mmetsp:Transcript_29250/g.92561  ORF Transcript_29250/g.92561 Transcript_29250/m.92561 type:complete len:290 (+) Transcript_29250:157-1026(+)
MQARSGAPSGESPDFALRANVAAPRPSMSTPAVTPSEAIWSAQRSGSLRVACRGGGGRRGLPISAPVISLSDNARVLRPPPRSTAATLGSSATSAALIAAGRPCRSHSSSVMYSTIQHGLGPPHAHRCSRPPERRRGAVRSRSAPNPPRPKPRPRGSNPQSVSGITTTSPPSAPSSSRLPTSVSSSMLEGGSQAPKPELLPARRKRPRRRLPHPSVSAASPSASGCHQPRARSTARRAHAPARTEARCAITAGIRRCVAYDAGRPSAKATTLSSALSTTSPIERPLVSR